MPPRKRTTGQAPTRVSTRTKAAPKAASKARGTKKGAAASSAKAKGQRTHRRKAKADADAESKEDYQPPIDDDNAPSSELSDAANSDNSGDDTASNDSVRFRTHQLQMTEVQDVHPAPHRSKKDTALVPAQTSSRDDDDSDDGNPRPPKKARSGIARTKSLVVESEDEGNVDIPPASAPSPTPTPALVHSVLKPIGRLIPGTPAMTHSRSLSSATTPPIPLASAPTRAQSAAPLRQHALSDQHSSKLPAPSAISHAPTPLEPPSTPQATRLVPSSHQVSTPLSPLYIPESPPRGPSPLFNSNSDTPVSTTVPSKRQRSRKQCTNTAADDNIKESRGLDQFPSADRALIQKASHFFKLGVLIENPFIHQEDFRRALVASWTSAHTALGKVLTNNTVPDNVTSYIRSFMSTVRGRVATESSRALVGASYGLSKDDPTALKAEQDRLVSGTWKAMYYEDTVARTGFCKRPLFATIIKAIFFPAHKGSRALGVLHWDRLQNGIPLPALALVLTCVEHTIRHFGASRIPHFTAAQVEPYKKHLARFAEIDKIAAAKAGASKPAHTPSQLLSLELLQQIRPAQGDVTSNQDEEADDITRSVEEEEAAAAAAAEFM